MLLSNPVWIRTSSNQKSVFDRRVRVDSHLYEYTGSDGEAYRKAFETKKNQIPYVPESGTHDSINKFKDQWR